MRFRSLKTPSFDSKNPAAVPKPRRLSAWPLTRATFCAQAGSDPADQFRSHTLDTLPRRPVLSCQSPPISQLYLFPFVGATNSTQLAQSTPRPRSSESPCIIRLGLVPCPGLQRRKLGMKIVFMGTPEFALIQLKAIAAGGHEVALVVTQPDRPSGRGRKTAHCPVEEMASGDGDCQ